MKEIYKDKNEATLKDIITKKAHQSDVKELIINDGSVLARTAFGTPLKDYAFYVDNKEGHVVQVTKLQERHLPALDAIHGKVKEDLIEERVTSLLRLRVDQARKEAQNKPLAQVAQTYKGTVKKVGPVDVHNTEKINALRKEGLPLERTVTNRKGGHD